MRLHSTTCGRKCIFGWEAKNCQTKKGRSSLWRFGHRRFPQIRPFSLLHSFTRGLSSVCIFSSPKPSQIQAAFQSYSWSGWPKHYFKDVIMSPFWWPISTIYWDRLIRFLFAKRLKRWQHCHVNAKPVLTFCYAQKYIFMSMRVNYNWQDCWEQETCLVLAQDHFSDHWKLRWCHFLTPNWDWFWLKFCQ